MDISRLLKMYICKINIILIQYHEADGTLKLRHVCKTYIKKATKNMYKY